MRAPFQTLVILYKIDKKEILYGIFFRKKEKIWQFISGGGENQETTVETAIREISEETGLNIKENELKRLDAKSTIPVVNIKKKFYWGENIFVIPEYCFAVNINNKRIAISDEHEKVEWVNYVEAMNKLKYDSNKTALWELNEKLKREYNIN